VSDINTKIDEQVKQNDVFLYMKGTPDFPQCGFSNQVVQILNYLGVEYQSANVLADPELREGIKAYTNWPTIPQLYVKGEFVGGADIVREMFQAANCSSTSPSPGSRSSSLRPDRSNLLITRRDPGHHAFALSGGG
jgi:monothiol glutaredoxin